MTVADAAPVIIGARRVGAALRTCAAAAGVPWTTLRDWLRRGREALAGDEVSEADRPFAELAAELDRCAAELETLLRERVVEHTRDDGRLALDTLKWIEGERQRRADRALTDARARVEEQRAAGELVERQRVEGVGVRVYLPEES
jgi:hypothetical protein